MNDTTSRQLIVDAIYDAFSYAYCDNCENAMNEDLCGDCHRKYQNWSASKKVIEEVINNLPPVQPERKKGEWIKMSDADGIYFACSICGENLPRIQHFDPQFDLFPRLKSIDKTNYCPNCGADMRGEQDGNK